MTRTRLQRVPARKASGHAHRITDQQWVRIVGALTQHTGLVGHERRNHVDQLREAGDVDAVRVPQQRVDQAAHEQRVARDPRGPPECTNAPDTASGASARAWDRGDVSGYGMRIRLRVNVAPSTRSDAK